MTDSKFGDFYVRVVYSKNKFISYARREPFTNCIPIFMEPGDLWFEFGNTEEEAVNNITMELRKLMN